VAPRTASDQANKADRSRSTDDQASELLLAFARMARGQKGGGTMPKHIEELVQSGFLAPRHLGAFAIIALEGPLTVSELAARGAFALSTTSLLVTQLAEANLVERHEDEHDRRRTVVSVAPKYRRMSQAVLEAKLAPLRRAVERMGPERSRALVEGLHMVAEEVIRADEVGGSCHGTSRTAGVS
jgi:DNA-binding MarR family transcriptional regulator